MTLHDEWPRPTQAHSGAAAGRWTSCVAGGGHGSFNGSNSPKYSWNLLKGKKTLLSNMNILGQLPILRQRPKT